MRASERDGDGGGVENERWDGANDQVATKERKVSF